MLIFHTKIKGFRLSCYHCFFDKLSITEPVPHVDLDIKDQSKNKAVNQNVPVIEKLNNQQFQKFPILFHK